MIALPDLGGRLAQDCGAETLQIANYAGDWLAMFRKLAHIPDDPGLTALQRVHDSPPDELLRLYLSLAAGQADVAPLRSVLFATYCRRFSTGNLTLRNVAARFLTTLTKDDQARLLQTLQTLLPSGVPERVDADLVSALAETAAEWLVSLGARPVSPDPHLPSVPQAPPP
jgi:hypothetical protein